MYEKYINEFHEWNLDEIYFIKNLLWDNNNQTEIEEILDYLYSQRNKKLDLSKFNYELLRDRKIKWHKKLQAVSSKDNEVEWTDYEITLDFWDGFRFVKLISKECYEREGKLMSHCVASYFGRDSKIYSLRDSNNNPHCTIEDWVQIKGKWNWKIDPKYIDYVVRFLEHLWMEVRESEMKNLWYYKLDSIDKDLTCTTAYNWYVYENKFDNIKDKEGRVYKWFWLWNVKDIVEIEDNWKFRLFEDVKAVTEYTVLVNNADIEWDYAQNASSWDYAKNASSWYSARNASSWDLTQSIVTGKYSITADIGHKSKSKWIIWTWIVLAEYDTIEEEWKIYRRPIAVKCGQIDWVVLKENTFYTLKDGEFQETN